MVHSLASLQHEIILVAIGLDTKRLCRLIRRTVFTWRRKALQRGGRRVLAELVRKAERRRMLESGVAAFLCVREEGLTRKSLSFQSMSQLGRARRRVFNALQYTGMFERRLNRAIIGLRHSGLLRAFSSIRNAMHE